MNGAREVVLSVGCVLFALIGLAQLSVGDWWGLCALWLAYRFLVTQ